MRRVCVHAYTCTQAHVCVRVCVALLSLQCVAHLLALAAVVVVVVAVVAPLKELPLSHTHNAMGLLIKSKINYSLRRRSAEADDDNGDFALAKKKTTTAAAAAA